MTARTCPHSSGRRAPRPRSSVRWRSRDLPAMAAQMAIDLLVGGQTPFDHPLPVCSMGGWPTREPGIPAAPTGKKASAATSTKPASLSLGAGGSSRRRGRTPLFRKEGSGSPLSSRLARDCFGTVLIDAGQGLKGFGFGVLHQQPTSRGGGPRTIAAMASIRRGNMGRGPAHHVGRGRTVPPVVDADRRHGGHTSNAGARGTGSATDRSMSVANTEPVDPVRDGHPGPRRSDRRLRLPSSANLPAIPRSSMCRNGGTGRRARRAHRAALPAPACQIVGSRYKPPGLGVDPPVRVGPLRRQKHPPTEIAAVREDPRRKTRKGRVKHRIDHVEVHVWEHR